MDMYIGVSVCVCMHAYYFICTTTLCFSICESVCVYAYGIYLVSMLCETMKKLNFHFVTMNTHNGSRESAWPFSLN
jgi:hypothetical protein